jgi:hypothetical protein
MGRGANGNFDILDIERFGIAEMPRRYDFGLMWDANSQALHFFLKEDRQKMIDALFGNPEVIDQMIDMPAKDKSKLRPLFEDIALRSLIGSSHNNKIRNYFENLYRAVGIEASMSFNLAVDIGNRITHIFAPDEEATFCQTSEKLTNPVVISAAAQNTLCEDCKAELGRRDTSISEAVVALFVGGELPDYVTENEKMESETWGKALKSISEAMFKTIEEYYALEKEDLFKRAEESGAQAFLNESIVGVAKAVSNQKDTCPRALFSLGIVSSSPEYQALGDLYSEILKDPQGSLLLKDWTSGAILEGALTRAIDKGHEKDIAKARWKFLTEVLYENNYPFASQYASMLEKRRSSGLSDGEKIFLSRSLLG